MRILQITDLHIVPEPGAEIYGTDPHRSLQHVLETAMSLDPPPELVMATGDLTEAGDGASYERLRGLLLTTGLPTFVMPGNHDSYRGLRDILAGGAIALASDHVIGEWLLVFVDSRVRGEAHGHVASWDAIDASMRQCAAPHVLLALHHSPIAPCPSPGCKLREAGSFLAGLAARPRVRAVVAGHSHLAAEMQRPTLRVYTTPSTCSQAWHAQPGESEDHDDFWASHRFDASRYGFRIVDLTADGSLTTKVHWLDNPTAG
jgi:Icc protein